MGKIRLDALLVKNGQVQSRERAKALIMAEGFSQRDQVVAS